MHFADDKHFIIRIDCHLLLKHVALIDTAQRQRMGENQRCLFVFAKLTHKAGQITPASRFVAFTFVFLQRSKHSNKTEKEEEGC